LWEAGNPLIVAVLLLLISCEGDDIALRMLGFMSQHFRVIVELLDDLTLKDWKRAWTIGLLKQCPRQLGAAETEIKLDRIKRVFAAETGQRAKRCRAPWKNLATRSFCASQEIPLL